MMDLNTREIATCIWLAVFLIFVVAKARESLLELLRACVQWAILKVVILMMAYVAVCVALLAWRDLWTLGNLKTTILWIIAAGFGGLFQASKIDEDAHFFRKALKGTFAFTVIVEFLIGAYTFSLGVELLLIPFLVFLTLLVTVGKSQPGSARVVGLIEWLLAFIGLWLLGRAIYEAAAHFRQLATADQARELVVPIMLSLMYLPFLYALNIYMVYERIFTMLQFGIQDAGIRRYAKRSILISFRSDVDLLKRWRRLVNVERPGSRSAVRETIREIQETRKRQRNPVAVDPGDGWAPTTAIRFLEADGFTNEDYHRTFVGWASSSNHVMLDGSVSLGTIAHWEAAPWRAAMP